jgi:hypothetical protein
LIFDFCKIASSKLFEFQVSKQTNNMMDLTTCFDKIAPCWFSFKGLIFGDVNLAQRERRLYEFNRSDLPFLNQGQVFLLVQNNEPGSGVTENGTITTATNNNTATTNNPLSSAFFEKKFTSIAAVATEKLGLKTTPKPLEKILVRLSIPAKDSSGATTTTTTTTTNQPDESNSSLLQSAISTVIQPEKPTISLLWSSLALEKNKPRVEGTVPLHRVQICREKATGWSVLDHEGTVLLEVKCPPETEQASLTAGRWVSAITNAMGVLAPQLEEEAAASRGSSYREKRLEQLRVRQEEREKQKQALGLDKVGLTYTAKAMMKG